MSFYKTLVICFLLLTNNQQNQFVEINEDAVEVTKKNEIASVVIPFKIKQGFHIQDIDNVKDNLIATVVAFQDHDDYEIVDQILSLSNYENVTLDKVKHQVLSDEFEVTITLKQRNNSNFSNSTLLGSVYYQTCNSKQCFFPRTLKFEISID
jgi:hypothetical protein